MDALRSLTTRGGRCKVYIPRAFIEAGLAGETTRVLRKHLANKQILSYTQLNSVLQLCVVLVCDSLSVGIQVRKRRCVTADVEDGPQVWEKDSGMGELDGAASLSDVAHSG